jgi:hypothetical protein
VDAEAPVKDGEAGVIRAEITAFQREKLMPFIDIAERKGMEKGLLRGIEECLEVKFGAEGLELMPELRELHDHELLKILAE